MKKMWTVVWCVVAWVIGFWLVYNATTADTFAMSFMFSVFGTLLLISGTFFLARMMRSR